MTRHRLLLGGLGLMAFTLLAAPILWPGEATAPDLAARQLDPSLAHPMGTDRLGRDRLARLLLGGQISAVTGLAGMALTLLLGCGIGLVAGMSRRLDPWLMRLTDLCLALPTLPMMLLMVMLFRAPLSGLFGATLGAFVLVTTVIAVTSWMQTARLIRAEVLRLQGMEFTRAARAMGTPPLQVVTRHILPSCMAPLATSATLAMAQAMIAESALSFLGLGFPPGTPSLGGLLHEALPYLGLEPTRALAPGLLLSLIVLTVTWAGEDLRNRYDPKA
ncbi:ABC transporter permease [Roseovarius sp. A21]|uniref:ABC transporter permease n=1 Tax=Roseovarius bejariae TaxID=2576383 RepID=A0A844CXK6_9RHOB|nr:ABC transporter permease [Roseovarius bejariae]MRU14363.1 ABC transporter permease [Roseovarius bejariae]